ncbi:OmpA family protein [Carboxylicivirga sp. N1Y90]|uniref:OmpA family protein n=1 Tax=Carboxylicivirga fragile TaxID=3417571 RepID=UPI003D33C077|nr:OmpA family protein [Marinilabiliaceae bacterium N1Y90]
MKRIVTLSLVICFVLLSSHVKAQIDFGSLEEEQIYRKGNKYNTWSVTAGFGPVIYYVDVIDYTVFPSHNWKFGPTLMLSKQFNRPWGLDAQFLMADMYGEKNGRYFSGDLLDFSLNVTFSINQFAIFGPINDRWNIYGKLGFGLVYFRSRQQSLYDRNISGEDVAKDQYLQVKHVYPFISGYPDPHGWEADDYLAIGYNRRGGLPVNETTRKNEIVIPFGFGVKYRINKNFDIGAEVLMRSMNADNLDVNLSGADNDSYMSTSFNLTYKIGKKNKRHAAWTYKDFNFQYKRQRQHDPLAHRLDSLKQEIALLAASDSLSADTTTIYTETVMYQEGISESVYFDFDKSEITRRSHRSLAKLARVLQQNDQIRIRIVGYCDARGSVDYNLRLSQRRCKAVLDVLVNDYKLARDRFQTDPKGESELLSDTEKLENGLHLVNRRVDMFVIIE